jgi:hypothetical protein
MFKETDVTDPKDELLRRADERRRIAENLQSQAEALEQAAADFESEDQLGDDEPAKKSIGRR